MARTIKNLPKKEPVTVDDPYGRIKDESGLNVGDGTVSNDASVGDVLVTMQRVMEENGVVPNNLPDNAAEGFQMYEGLTKIPPPDDSVSTVKIQDGSIIPSKIADGVTYRVDSISGGTDIYVSTVALPSWDLTTTSSVSIPTGLVDSESSVVAVDVLIFSSINGLIPLYKGGYYNVTNTVNSVDVFVDSGGFFDTPEYSDTGFSRGVLRFEYQL